MGRAFAGFFSIEVADESFKSSFICLSFQDILADYVEFINEENSKKKIMGDVDVPEGDIPKKGIQECVDHLLVEEDVSPQPLPTDEEIRMDRRAARKRRREECEVVHDLLEWDGRFDEDYDTDAMENGGVYDFSSNSEVDEYYDLDMLGVSIETMKVDSAGNEITDDKGDDDDADSDYVEFLQTLQKAEKGDIDPDYAKWLQMELKKKGTKMRMWRSLPL